MVLQIVQRKLTRNRKKKKVRLSPEEKEQQKRKKILHGRVLSTFKNMQFEYLHSDGKHKKYDGQNGESDNIFVFENIILLVEETISHSSDHIRKKHYYFEKILQEFPSFIDWLSKEFKDNLSKFDDFGHQDYRIFYLYACDYTVELDVKENFKKILFLDSPNLDYFKSMSDTLKYTSRLELFKFLGLEHAQIGIPKSSSDHKNIETGVIIPQSASGFPDGVQVLTFVMQAKELMECSYVLRKDSWDISSGLYQRLLDKRRIEAIRKFLVAKQRTFIDSVIVSLPPNVTFSAKKWQNGTLTNEPIKIFDANVSMNITMSIPYLMNSIGIIDGQHRVFSHYQGNDTNEEAINRLRTKRHLFVTGLFYDITKFNEVQKRQFESELFLQINNEQKRVKPALLQYIESLHNPVSPTGLANATLEYLNKSNPFLGLFNTSPLSKGGIPTPTILRYGLIGLVSIDKSRVNLHTYWIREGNSPANEIDDLNSYVAYCGKRLSYFFSALKENNKPASKTDTSGMVWNDRRLREVKILSVTSIVGFIRAYEKSLQVFDGPQDFAFYKEKLKPLALNLSNYKSSHWNDLADEVNRQCWKK